MTYWPLFGDTVTRVRAGTRTDRAGNQVADWSNADRLDIAGVSVQPNSESESLDPGRDLVVTTWRVLTQPNTDADVAPTDRIEWQGMTLDVVGEVARWGSVLPHTEWTMQRAEG